MKVLILAGGYGSRLSEETIIKPKPMVEIGDKPILWHIMKIYSFYGYDEFIVLLGYKGNYVKDFFVNYCNYKSDIEIDLETGSVYLLNNKIEKWKVTLLDTGLETMTGGRLKYAQKYVGEKRFMLTYGDGVADINIADLVNFHKKHGKLITMTSAQPEGRFGALDILEDNRVGKFIEKPKGDGAWINAGFFVCEPEVFDFIENDQTVFEREPLMRLAQINQLYTFKHQGFWHPMDTIKDKNNLSRMWLEEQAPWKVWK